MSTSTAAPTLARAPRDLRLWAPLGAATLAWFALYRLNGPLWDWLVYDVAHLTGRLGETVHFFFFDTVKILLLLIGIIFLVTILRSFVSIERTRAMLGGRREGVGNVAAAGLGVITPFCSCSAVPVFIGFVSAGVPIGVTLSFLIAAPMVNEVALVLLYGMFGWKIALIYVTTGLLIAVVAGFVLGHMHAERWIESFVFETKGGGAAVAGGKMTSRDRVGLGREEVTRIVGKVLPYLLIGIGLGAIVHGWVPTDFFARYAGASNPLAVPFAVLLGIPLYSNAAGILPLVEALHSKGLPMGTLLAFMMAVVALSLPEMILLRRILKPQLIGIFIAVVAGGILIVGYLFNAIL